VHDAFPGLWKGTAVPELALGGLTPRASERLVRAALGERVAPDVVSRIVERSDGNAFYLEELVRRVSEGSGDAMPETVLALVQSRLERLEPEARRLVRAASVFGEVFWRGAVAALLGGAAEPEDVEVWLKALVEREVFVAADETRFPGEREYRFRHGLLREAAYAMLTESDGVKGHRLAGEWLEAMGEKDALTMADHFERGAESSRAVGWLLRAADAAGEGGNVKATLRLVDRGLACRPMVTERGRFLLARASALSMRADWEGVANTGREAMVLLPVGSVSWFSAAAVVFTAGSFLGDPSIAAPMLQAIINVSVPPEPSGPYAMAVHCVCVGLTFMGQFDLARSFLERAETSGKDVSDLDPVFVLRLLIARGYVEVLSGQIGKGLVDMTRARTLAYRAGDTWAQAAACTFCATALSQAGDCEGTEAAARDVMQFSEIRFFIDWSVYFMAYARIVSQSVSGIREAIVSIRALLDGSDPQLVANVRATIAGGLADTGDFDGAEREAVTLLGEASAPPSAEAGALITLARVALHRRQPSDALAFAERGWKASASGVRWLQNESLLHLVRAEALRTLGRAQDAADAIREARDRILGVAATLDDPELRASYVTKVAANARTLQLAREWLGEG